MTLRMVEHVFAAIGVLSVALAVVLLVWLASVTRWDGDAHPLDR